MAEIEIYSTKVCPYCDRAKSLLDRKGAPYSVIDVSDDAELRAVMMQRSGGRRTVPQIFINGEHIGGCDDLYALESAGTLDGKLGTAP